jgi:hypothetical protein
MIIIGGQFPLDPNVNNCDAPAVAGVHNLNMGKNDPEKSFWSLYETNLTTYDVPIDIQNIIGGVYVCSLVDRIECTEPDFLR